MRFYEVNLEPLARRLFKFWVHGVTWTREKLKNYQDTDIDY